MRTRTINSYSQKIIKKLFDKIGGLSKSIKMRRMEPYADIIGAELSKYNTDDYSRTMMFKLLREPVEGTTTRGKHAENLKEIAGKIADEFDWLSSDLTRVMAREHDTGHTMMGHSGEWWFSSIKDTYGMGNYVHNALGARKLVYRNDIFSDVEKAIKEQYPDIISRKLNAIKRDLWLIIDGINCHNGEKSEYSYEPNFLKTKKRFYDEIMGCFVKKGYDKMLEPATTEGSLMRLCDKISYIPLDLVDSFRNGCNIESYEIDGKTVNFYEQYKEKFSNLGMPVGSLERLLNCKTNEDYDNFAYQIQEILIADVIKNTKRNNIRMSPETSKTMHGIRDINNSMMVNYTVMKEDHEVYPEAMKNLMESYADVLTSNFLINSQDIYKSPIRTISENETLKKSLIDTYSSRPDSKRFAEYVAETNPRDFDFTVEMIKKAFEETIDNELEVAKTMSVEKVNGITVEAQGNKKERLDTYIKAFEESLEVAYLHNLFSEVSGKKIDEFKKDLWLNKTKAKLKPEVLSSKPMNSMSAGSISVPEMVALEMSAQYLSSLNDEEFKQVLLDSGLVKPEKMESLTRTYQSFDFRDEHKKHTDWDNIAKLQAKSTETINSDKVNDNLFSKFKKMLGKER